jgi:50S ribosomal subunit-associated GTPase HflX
VDIPTILVFNKVDQIKPTEEAQEVATSLEDVQQVPPCQKHGPAVFISATQQDNMVALKDLLFQQVHLQHMTIYPNYLKNDTH